MSDANRKQIFISYSHKDNKEMDELMTMLKGKFQGSLEEENVRIWDDTKIQAGEKWEEKINEALSSASVVVLIVTKNFLASDFIMKIELPKVFVKENQGSIKIAWIYWGFCNYEGTALEKYQSLNDLSSPLGSLGESEREAKLSEIAHIIYMLGQ